jgi:hypothetical protein
VPATGNEAPWTWNTFLAISKPIVVTCIDAAEKVVVRKQLRRRQVLEFFKALPPCLVGMVQP